MTSSPMLIALSASGPAPDRAQEMALYGQFVGSWSGQRIVHEPGGARRTLDAEVHFDWVLQGRAVQDVWIARQPGNGAAVMYGTTLRVYDPAAGHWHILWFDPVTQYSTRMIGRRSGADIVQDCRLDDGTLRQWMFTEIAGDTFQWIGRERAPDERDWRMRVEFFLRRIG